MGILNYGRHFALLALLAASLAAMHRWSSAPGILAEFAVYGGLHAAAVALTLRAPQPAARRWWFVVMGASLSLSSAAIGLRASRAMGAPMGMAQLAMSLSLSSGLGAATYAGLMRLLFRARLPLAAIIAIVLGCIAATLAVLLSGGYLKGGGLLLAASWWFAMSLGLWFFDACPRPRTMGPSEGSRRTERR